MAAPAASGGGGGKIVLIVLLLVLVLGGGVAALLVVNNRNSVVSSPPVVALTKCANAGGKATAEGTLTNASTANTSFAITVDFGGGNTGTVGLADMKPADSRTFTVSGTGEGTAGFKCKLDAKST